jgi:hypothetical protein
MGVSTNGQICYGILFDEGFEFPWDDDKYEGDFSDWWVHEACGYKNPFEIYDENGNFLGGEEPARERIVEYYKAKREFQEKHSCPIEIVNYCSGEYPMYILALRKSCLSCSRGYPDGFEPTSLVASDEDKERLLEFCREHGIEHDDEPGWWLSSYWG